MSVVLSRNDCQSVVLYRNLPRERRAWPVESRSDSILDHMSKIYLAIFMKTYFQTASKGRDINVCVRDNRTYWMEDISDSVIFFGYFSDHFLVTFIPRNYDPQKKYEGGVRLNSSPKNVPGDPVQQGNRQVRGGIPFFFSIARFPVSLLPYVCVWGAGLTINT